MILCWLERAEVLCYYLPLYSTDTDTGMGWGSLWTFGLITSGWCQNSWFSTRPSLTPPPVGRLPHYRLVGVEVQDPPMVSTDVITGRGLGTCWCEWKSLLITLPSQTLKWWELETYRVTALCGENLDSPISLCWWKWGWASGFPLVFGLSKVIIAEVFYIARLPLFHSLARKSRLSLRLCCLCPLV